MTLLFELHRSQFPIPLVTLQNLLLCKTCPVSKSEKKFLINFQKQSEGELFSSSLPASPVLYCMFWEHIMVS